MAQEFSENVPQMHPHQTNHPFPDNIQQLLSSILEQNPAAAHNDDMKAQLQRMMESEPIRDQIQG